MRKTILFMIVITAVLVACSSQASTQSAIATTAAQPSPATVAAKTDSPAAATDAPAIQAPAVAGTVVFKIVPGESQLQYEVGETFLENNRFNNAVGVTPQVDGEITVDQASPQNSSISTITADISQFKSDSGRRDGIIRQRFLESSKYPNVTFVPTKIEGLPTTYQAGQDIPLKITGNLTIRDVTKPVTFDAVIRSDGTQLTGQATTTILMSDFGFGPISIGGMLNTQDEVKITLTIVARP